MKRKLLIALGVLIVSGLVFAAVETKFYGNINLQNNKVVNMGTPTSNSDGANKSYVDTQVHTRLNKQGGQLTGTLDMQTNYIIRVKKPRSGVNGKLDATPRDYVDGATNAVVNYAHAYTDTISTNLWKGVYQRLRLSGGTMSGNISMGSQKITDLGTPTATYDATTKRYVDDADDTRLPLTGGVMSGNIGMGGHKITNIGNPTANLDAATKQYVDNAASQANAYQYFALKKGSSFTPIYDLSHNSNRYFEVKVIRQFTGAITCYYENIRAWAMPMALPNKTFKVGETIKVPFKLLSNTYIETNGTLIVKADGGVLGNFGITVPPNGLVPFTCQVGVNGEYYNPNTSVDISSIWDSGGLYFEITIKNTTGRNISTAGFNFYSAREYNSTTDYTLAMVEHSGYSPAALPCSSSISGWLNGEERVIKVSVPNFGASAGLVWGFQVFADGETYYFGQFFIPNSGL